MKLGFGQTLVKFILFLFNFLCVLCGIALIIIGAVILAELGNFQSLLEANSVNAPPVVSIILGAIVFIIAFFGCCGAYKESYCMTTTYSFLMLTLIILQIIVAVLIFVYIGDVSDAATLAMKTIFEAPSNPANTDFIDFIQRELQCCEINGPVTSPLRESCCSPDALACTTVNAFQTGCSTAFIDFIESLGQTLGYVAIGLAAVQLVAVILSCCLANKIRRVQKSARS
jgi:CD63 antigen